MNENKLKVGDIFYCQKGLPNDKPYKCHVLAIVDEYMVVYKWYGRRKQWWHYEVEHKETIDFKIEHAKGMN
jgi:hypothetical protein